MTVGNPRKQKLILAADARRKLVHPHLVPARVARDERGRMRIVLKTQQVPSLSDVLASGPLEVRDSLRLLYGVATAADALNAAGLVARDLRPERILVSPRVGGVLADAGIPLELLPRDASPGDKNGGYRSPEECAGLPIDSRSNVYSLAAVFLSTMKAPNGEHMPLPAPAQAVIRKAMMDDRERRYARCPEFVVTLAASFGLRRNAGRRSSLAPERQVRQAAERGKDRPAQPVTPREASGSPPSPAQNGSSQTRKPARPPRHGQRRRRGRTWLETPSSEGVGPRETEPQTHPSDQPQPKSPSRPRPRVPALPRFRVPRAPRLPALPRLRRPVHIGPTAVGIAAALAACVLIAVLLARGLSGDDPPARVASPAFDLALPSGWAEAKVARMGAIELSSAVAAAPLGQRGAGLVAGEVPDMVVLDRRFREEGTRSEVRLGPLQAWRYAGLRPSPGLTATAYLAPTTGDSLLVLCHARLADARAVLPQCHEIASTIMLRGERPASLARLSRAQAQLAQAMGALREARVVGRRRLAEMDRAKRQAGVARALARAYGKAADKLAGIASPEGAISPPQLVESLRATASAYRDLAQAAAKLDKAGFRDAGRVIDAREAAVERGAAEWL